MDNLIKNELPYKIKKLTKTGNALTFPDELNYYSPM
ncbi:hypothetical protein SAMN03097699_1633 [Flavobacteriaceae bacterium MAR_2010_188]|nr:hypothetical protein SAMN03097699_1633 [Flavobacteriaceae bacterium MAR_2010_188]